MTAALDANIVIYLVEANPIWAQRVTARITALRAAGDDLAVCDAARLECLIKPIATANTAAQASYQTFFGSTTILMLPVTIPVWEGAARLRAIHRLPALDCIHLAAAIVHGCGLFLTNDAALTRCTEIPVEVLT